LFFAHNLGRVHHMYARHLEGYLELEIGDLGWSEIFRVMVIDHDLISFQDINLDQWPVILITNPKDASFLVPTREPFQRISLSTHIRFLPPLPSQFFAHWFKSQS